MKCPECMGTDFEQGQFEIGDTFQQQPVLIMNVPAFRCEQCGYVLVAAKTSKEIAGVLRTRRPNDYVPAAVYDLDAPQPTPNRVATPVMQPIVAGNGGFGV